MTFDKLLVLLIAPACKITFAVEHFKCGSGKSFMSSIVAPRKILTLKLNLVLLLIVLTMS